MKYIKKFNTRAEYNAAKDDLELPNVSLIVEEMEWNGKGINIIHEEYDVLVASLVIPNDKGDDEVIEIYKNDLEDFDGELVVSWNVINAFAGKRASEIHHIILHGSSVWNYMISDIAFKELINMMYITLEGYKRIYDESGKHNPFNCVSERLVGVVVPEGEKQTYLANWENDGTMVHPASVFDEATDKYTAEELAEAYTKETHDCSGK